MSSSRVSCLAALAALLVLATPARAVLEQNPYGPANPTNQGTLPPPTSPYPDLRQMPAGPGANQPPVPQPQGGYNQPAPPPAGQAPAAGGPVLNDVLGRFRLGLPADAAPVGVTYNLNLPSHGAQLTIMSLAQPQVYQYQRQAFEQQIPQMGGRIIDQRPLNLNNRQAELVVVMINNPQNNTQMVVYNVFVPSATLWIQVMGQAQAQTQLQQLTGQILQALALN